MAGGGGGPSNDPAAEREHKKAEALAQMEQKIAASFPAVPQISCSDARSTGGIIFVDVRGQEEVAVSMLPGAVTRSQFEARKAELSERKIICYCTIGYRSSVYASKLRQQGWDARNLEGGCVRWAQQRLPLVARDASGAEQPVKRIHVYGKPWALAPDDFDQVMFPRPVVATLRSFLPTWLGGRKA